MINTFTDRSQVSGAVKAEIYVGRCKRGWRWDLIYLRIADVDMTLPGTLGVQGRTHLGGDVGYTRTRLGAWWQAAKAFHRAPYAVI